MKEIQISNFIIVSGFAVALAGCGGASTSTCKPLSAWSGPGSACSAGGEKVAMTPAEMAPPEETWEPAPAVDGTDGDSGWDPDAGATEEPVVEEPPADPVRVTEDGIEFDEQVQFKKAKAKILPASSDLLDNIAQVLKDNPDIKKIEIRGYTDSRGNKRKNKRLSKKRARAVLKYLKKKGIKARRMKAKGLGPADPIADNDTAEGREQNRRVEIKILKRR